MEMGDHSGHNHSDMNIATTEEAHSDDHINMNDMATTEESHSHHDMNMSTTEETHDYGMDMTTEEAHEEAHDHGHDMDMSNTSEPTGHTHDHHETDNGMDMNPTEESHDHDHQMDTGTTEMKSVSLEILVSGITEDNKESVCTSVADALSGTVTHCSLTSPTSRRLLTYHTLYVDVQVESADTAAALVAGNTFVDDLILPESIDVSGATVPVVAPGNDHHHDHTSSGSDDSVDCSSGNGNAMTCLHIGCCEWHPNMSMCVDAPEPTSDANPLNRCPEATDIDNCQHFGHAHECQGVTYTCVWDADSGTCDRQNDCASQMEMHCSHYQSEDYTCVWTDGACVVSEWKQAATTEEPQETPEEICASQSSSMCSHYHHMNSDAGFECVWNSVSSTCEVSSSSTNGSTDAPEENGNAAICASQSSSTCAHYHHMNNVDFQCAWNDGSSTCEVSSEEEGGAMSTADSACAANDGHQLGCEHYHHNNVVTFACVYNADTNTCSATTLSNGAAMDHSMMMYFHTGIGDILWFEDFKTDTDSKYTAACFAILAFAIVREISVLYRRKIKKILNGQKQGTSFIGPDFSGKTKTQTSSDIMYYSGLDTLLVGISMFASYMLMLAFMTYNMGFCVVTIASFMITNFYMHMVSEDPEIMEDCCSNDVEDHYPSNKRLDAGCSEPDLELATPKGGVKVAE